MVTVGYPFKITGITNVYIGWSVRAAAGDQAIIGVGFVPKVVIFVAKGAGGVNAIHSIGFDDASKRACVYFPGDGVAVGRDTSKSIITRKDVGNYIDGYIKSMDADGFTITWALTGGMTSEFIYLAMK